MPTITPIVPLKTPTPTPTPPVQECPAECTCLSKEDAYKKFGTTNIEPYLCLGKDGKPIICGYIEDKPKYCFKRIVPKLCPSGCECLSEDEAYKKYGDAYLNYLCKGEKIICGYENGKAKYCFEVHRCEFVYSKCVGTCPPGYECKLTKESEACVEKCKIELEKCLAEATSDVCEARYIECIKECNPKCLCLPVETPAPTPIPPPEKCPSSCVCLSKEEAYDIFGENFEDYLCKGEKIICGYDERKNPKYCFEVPRCHYSKELEKCIGICPENEICTFAKGYEECLAKCDAEYKKCLEEGYSEKTCYDKLVNCKSHCKPECVCKPITTPTPTPIPPSPEKKCKFDPKALSCVGSCPPGQICKFTKSSMECIQGCREKQAECLKAGGSKDECLKILIECMKECNPVCECQGTPEKCYYDPTLDRCVGSCPPGQVCKISTSYIDCIKECREFYKECIETTCQTTTTAVTAVVKPTEECKEMCYQKYLNCTKVCEAEKKCECTPAPSEVCPAGCECLTRKEALEKFKKPVLCTTKPCGKVPVYYATLTATYELKYCFREGAEYCHYDKELGKCVGTCEKGECQLFKDIYGNYFCSCVASATEKEVWVERVLPESTEPSSCFEVILVVTPREKVTGVVVTETYPTEFRYAGASPTPDKIKNNTLKWLLYSKEGVEAQKILYKLCVPSDASGYYYFKGTWETVEKSGVIAGNDRINVLVSEEGWPPYPLTDAMLLKIIEQWAAGKIDDFKLLQAIESWAMS